MLIGILKKIDEFRSLKAPKSAVQNKRKAGFTIVELMVVIIIINLLSGVAVPKLTDYIERTRQKIDVLRLYNLRDALNRALYESDIHTVEGTGGSNGCKNVSSADMDSHLSTEYGMVMFLVEKHSYMPVNYQGTGNGANNGSNMCGLFIASGFWKTALAEGGFGAVGDIITDRAAGNKFNANSKTYTWVKQNKNAGILWDRTYPTNPIFISRFLNADGAMTGESQSTFVLKIQWSGRNPQSHSLEVFLAQNQSKKWNESLRSRQGVCFSTYGEAGCKNTR